MSHEEIKTLSKNRFDVYINPLRRPTPFSIGIEKAWFCNHNESIIGVVILAIQDNDYVTITHHRDNVGRYNFNSIKTNISTLESAEEQLKNDMVSQTNLFKYEDSRENSMINLFETSIPEDRLHPYFKKLRDLEQFSHAKEMIQHLMPHFKDIDGNFVEQFQTTGFDSRLWELYLNFYLIEEQMGFKRIYHAPDFMVEKFGTTVAIEAVTVGRKSPIDDDSGRYSLSPSEIKKMTENDMPIKWGSPLFSKLRKRYWELEHVKGNPLIIAIADFHDNGSMLWSSTSLIEYLYGKHDDYHYDDNGKLVIEPKIIENHQVGSKCIPSGFFFQEDAENISAVISSASATICKFSRMGKQAGLGSPEVSLARIGFSYKHDENASKPDSFSYVVDENCEEKWSEGLSMFHNPNAKHPVPMEMFPSISHHFHKDGMTNSYLQPFHPYCSQTLFFPQS